MQAGEAASGTWQVLLSGSAYAPSSLVAVGDAGVMPAPDDYDNDGKTDPAVYAPSLQACCVWMSSSGYNPAILSW